MNDKLNSSGAVGVSGGGYIMSTPLPRGTKSFIITF